MNSCEKLLPRGPEGSSRELPRGAAGSSAKAGSSGVSFRELVDAGLPTRSGTRQRFDPGQWKRRTGTGAKVPRKDSECVFVDGGDDAAIDTLRSAQSEKGEGAEHMPSQPKPGLLVSKQPLSGSPCHTQIPLRCGVRIASWLARSNPGTGGRGNRGTGFGGRAGRRAHDRADKYH